MRERRPTHPAAAGWRPHRARHTPRRVRSEPIAGATDGWLNVDLRAQPETHEPRGPRLPWRRPSGSYPTSLPLSPASPLTATARRRRLRLHPALAALLVVQALVAGLATWALTSWQVRSVRVQGASDAVVTRAIEALPLTGCVIFRCDLARDAQVVEALPAVAHATVSAAYPDTLVVVITLRTPALAWKTEQGELVIADDGTVLGTPQSDPAYASLRLPEVDDAAAATFAGTMPAAGARLDADLVKMATQLRTGMAVVLGDGWALDYQRGVGLAAVQSDGRRVLFGMPRDAAAMSPDDASIQTLGSPPSSATVAQGVRLQLDALQLLLQELARRGQQAALIDLRWGAHPYWRPATG
jgi:cell division septal protein FtsQ